jgi:hypothetical protein
MTIHTPIESPGRVDKNYAVFKIIYGVIRPIKAKNRVKMLKIDFFKIEKNLKKKSKLKCDQFFSEIYI